MLKVQLSAELGSKSNLRGIVWVEVEKGNFIALSGKGGHSGLMLSKPSVPTWGK